MKNFRNAIFAISLLLSVFISCTKEANVIITTPPVIDSGATVISRGVFSNGPYGTVSGNVQIVRQDSTLALLLTNFSSSSGPDLHVYLSMQAPPASFVELGSLRSTSGQQAYLIPSGTNLSLYRYALIHCQAYNHLFGSALLQ